jgi:hypothetical protein
MKYPYVLPTEWDSIPKAGTKRSVAKMSAFIFVGVASGTDPVAIASLVSAKFFFYTFFFSRPSGKNP